MDELDKQRIKELYLEIGDINEALYRFVELYVLEFD